MTKAEKFINGSQLSITLCYDDEDKDIDNRQVEDYLAEFKPGLPNLLHITDEKFRSGDVLHGNAIMLSYESAIKLAKFLKDIFLDEIPKD
jgi:hypothetical protein